MASAAKRAGRVLCVAENYRFDPLVRLTRALLQADVIGRPRLVLDHSVGSGGRIVITPWRHKRLYGGTLLDVGVHNVDLMAYYLGRIETVNAKVALLDKVRVAASTERAYERMAVQLGSIVSKVLAQFDDLSRVFAMRAFMPPATETRSESMNDPRHFHGN